jgi:hypothetical protein
MKKILSLAFIIALLTLSSIDAHAQKPFKGILTYTISYSGEITPAEIAQQPTEMTLYLRDNKSKTEIIQGGGMVIIHQIYNSNTGMAYSLFAIESMGMKFYLKTTKEQLEAKNAENEEPTITVTDETKEICGYTAKKVEYVTVDEYGDEHTTIVWVSEEFGGKELNTASQFPGLPGIPLEYSMEIDGVTTTFLVTEIKKGKVKKSDFLIPDDYEEKTEEELESLFGGE